MEFSYTRDGVRITDNDFVVMVGADDIHRLRSAMDDYHNRYGYFLRLNLVKNYWEQHNLPGGVKFDLSNDWFHIDIPSSQFGELTPLLMSGGVSFQCYYKDDFPCVKVHLPQFLSYIGEEEETS